MSDPTNRIFIAGDACHTHSPKVGAGMNISIQGTFPLLLLLLLPLPLPPPTQKAKADRNADAYNIGWKVASVAAALSPASILPTYGQERHPVARNLAEFDRQWSAHFAPGAGSKTDDFDATSRRFEDFGNGIVLDYPASVVVDKAGEGRAEKLVPGERFWPAKVARHADSEAKWTTGVMRSDGRWRVVVLAGDIAGDEQRNRLEALCKALENVIERVTPEGRKGSEVIDTVAIHCAKRDEVEIFDFPEILRPVDAKRGVDYDKIWVDEDQELDQDCDGKAFDKWGVDRTKGAVVVMRPDQYIGWIGELEDVEEMEKYFRGVLLACS